MMIHFCKFQNCNLFYLLFKLKAYIPFLTAFLQCWKPDQHFVSMTKCMKKRHIFPMHIHKRFTFEVDSHVRGNSSLEKQHVERGNTPGLFTFVWIQINRFVCYKQKIIRYCHLHFMRMAVYRCRGQSMRALLLFISIFIHWKHVFS